MMIVTGDQRASPLLVRIPVIRLVVYAKDRGRHGRTHHLRTQHPPIRCCRLRALALPRRAHPGQVPIAAIASTTTCAAAGLCALRRDGHGTDDFVLHLVSRLLDPRYVGVYRVRISICVCELVIDVEEHLKSIHT